VLCCTLPTRAKARHRRKASSECGPGEVLTSMNNRRLGGHAPHTASTNGRPHRAVDTACGSVTITCAELSASWIGSVRCLGMARQDAATCSLGGFAQSYGDLPVKAAQHCRNSCALLHSAEAPGALCLLEAGGERFGGRRNGRRQRWRQTAAACCDCCRRGGALAPAALRASFALSVHQLSPSCPRCCRRFHQTGRQVGVAPQLRQQPKCLHLPS